MNNKYAMNVFNCCQSNLTKKVHDLKCHNLPKKTKKQDKDLLKLIQILKRDK